MDNPQMVWEVKMTFTHAGSEVRGILIHRYRNRGMVAKRIGMNRAWLNERGHTETGLLVHEVPRFSPRDLLLEICEN